MQQANSSGNSHFATRWSCRAHAGGHSGPHSSPHWTVWTHPCPHGESIDDFGARADLVLSVALPVLDERDVVLVGHGHFSRALLTRWLGLPVAEGKRFAMAPAAHSVLGFDHSYRQLVVHNIDPSVRTGRKKP